MFHQFSGKSPKSGRELQNSSAIFVYPAGYDLLVASFVCLKPLIDVLVTETGNRYEVGTHFAARVLGPLDARAFLGKPAVYPFTHWLSCPAVQIEISPTGEISEWVGPALRYPTLREYIRYRLLSAFRKLSG